MGDGYPSDWNSRRKKIYKRDNYRCQECGSLGGKRGNAKLHAHHIKPKSEGGSHRQGNLKTVCKSCHENIHGHGVGGSATSSSGNSDQQDAAEMLITIVLMACATILVITLIAFGQVLPAGETVTEDYSIDYIGMSENPDTGDVTYDYNPGPSLNVQYELSDNVISQNDEAQLTFKIHNPSNNDIRGNLKVKVRANYANRGELSEIDFDLSPGQSKVVSITSPGWKFIANSGPHPRTATFGAESQIFTEQYKEIGTHRQSDEMTLEVRKPFFDRLGVYWLILLFASLTYGSYKLWGRRSEAINRN
ncbi:HNH endonuclease [Halorubrum tebenquichense]|uniref:HNH endonuclease n=1 Tax=Halorubrum tebenquichense DSM 14210 TaxID=1227485 RepID=M0E3L2_9EURY|nr:HNH endonuclease [Halorubrum tebenquichense]ELZ41618.1 HNH endonuclease [Halorubrum tebenquichense DSM 14210]